MTRYSEPNFPVLISGDFNNLRQFDKDLIYTLSSNSSNLKVILDAGISIKDNMDMVTASVVSDATPGVEFSLSHALGKVPLGYIVIGQDGAGSIYDGTTSNTKTDVYFKSDVGSRTFRLLLY